ncbi:uncharacterized protein si:dkey-154b15.1 isoform X2 [Triplophysa rosa]|uniref:uncharacterized protein si:dkey-154b15.1 isoform X2 n=1 Tax=Triplophysa rosa TaxID=992332 RepID=UPI002545CA75|nr:uncharacterized protein si:dkey-154b15.1 isoform X2 [Triplophysa rosa]
MSARAGTPPCFLSTGQFHFRFSHFLTHPGERITFVNRLYNASDSFIMDFVGMVIEVNGIPDYPSSKSSSMIDKLTMHFLRRSNNGQDVLTVIYPTSIKGQAYVVFESSEVPGVLQHTHVLEVDGQFYLLEVKRGYLRQLDMQAEAWLDGSFLTLKVLRPKLMELQAQESHIRRRTSSPYTNSYSNGSASNYGLSDLEYLNDSTPRRRPINGRSVHAGARSPSTGTTSGSPEFYKNLPLSRTDSPAEGSYSTQDSFSFLKTKNPSSARHTEMSFPVEADVFRYIMSFKKDVIKKIESEHRTQIKHEGDSEHLITVKLSGGACEEAAKELSSFMQEMASSLRTQEIDLNKLESRQKKQISQNVCTFQQRYTVLITQNANILQIVGTSSDSYQAMENILRLKSDIPFLTSLHKSVKRQSSSLPRMRREDVDIRQSPDTVLQATADIGYSASRYRTDSNSQQAAPKERGRQLIKSSVQQRVQSAEPRHKNKNKEDNALPPLDQQDLSPSSGAGTSKKGQSPNILKTLFPNTSLKKFTKRKTNKYD